MADEEHSAEEWGTAKVVESNEEAILIAGFLGSNGIRAEVESLHVDELPLTVGGLGEVRVRVPAGQMEEALALLARQDAEEASEEPASAGDVSDS
jgi:hypothetical protein